jgi:hypothetical protein
LEQKPLSFHYTSHKDCRIDESIQLQLDIIINEMVKTLPSIQSIVLSGGFGRGEGSVIEVDDSVFMPLNDYDLYAFCLNAPTVSEYVDLKKRIILKLGTVPGYNDLQAKADIQFIRLSAISRINPDMSTLGVKVASRVLWGSDLRSSIPITEENVPTRSVLLNAPFHSIAGLVKHFEPEYLKKGVPSSKIQRLNYECYKSYLAMGTTLALLHGFIEFYHLRRSRVLSQSLKSWFPDLCDEKPELANRIEKFTLLKLNSLSFNEMSDPIELWFSTRQDLVEVLGFAVHKLTGNRWDKSGDFYKVFENEQMAISYAYYQQYLEHALMLRGLPSRGVYPRILFFPAVIAMQASFAVDCWTAYHTLPVKRLLSGTPPLISLFRCASTLAESISESGIKKNLLKDAYSIISKMVSFNINSLNEDELWLETRNKCLDSMELNTHIVKRSV